LFFSGIGSQLSPRIPLGKALGILALWLACLPFLLSLVFDLALGLSFAARLLITILALIPTGFLMGVPFARGILWMQDTQMLQKMPVEPMIIPWVWAINGAASVIASVLAALLAITFGFDLVFLSGALCYLGACLIVTWQELTKERRRLARLQHR